jgi:hypothetical protein
MEQPSTHTTITDGAASLLVAALEHTWQPIGWPATTVPEHTAASYLGQLEELAAALVLWRRQEHRLGAGPRSRNLLAATCGCGRRIRVAKTTLAEAPILCSRCSQPFQPDDHDD